MNAFNKANRAKGLAKILDENKLLVDKLKKTKSSYNMNEWKEEHDK